MAKPIVSFVPAKKKYEGAIRTGIYCRVSSSKKDQLESLTVQISALTNHVAYLPTHVLYDTYIDIASGSNVVGRPGFQRLVKDCQENKIQYVITKSVSRFSRNIVDAMTAIRELTAAGAKIYFLSENIDSDNPDLQVILTIYLAVAEQENYSRSQNIKWGLRYGAEEGLSKNYDRVFYGYKHDKDGHLIIKDDEAENVRLIYRLYLDGHSIVSIIKELRRRKISSPTGKEKWNKRYIDQILSNRKYTGDSVTGAGANQYLFKDHHPAIISHEVFDAVEFQKQLRSNISESSDGSISRKNTKYSSKKVLRKTVDIEQLMSDLGFDEV